MSKYSLNAFVEYFISFNILIFPCFGLSFTHRAGTVLRSLFLSRWRWLLFTDLLFSKQQITCIIYNDYCNHCNITQSKSVSVCHTNIQMIPFFIALDTVKAISHSFYYFFFCQLSCLPLKTSYLIFFIRAMYSGCEIPLSHLLLLYWYWFSFPFFFSTSQRWFFQLWQKYFNEMQFTFWNWMLDIFSPRSVRVAPSSTFTRSSNLGHFMSYQA